MLTRLVKVRGLAWKLAIPAVALAAAGQLALPGAASASRVAATAGHSAAAATTLPATIKPNKVNNMDCNGWSKTYNSARPAMKSLCTDPVRFALKTGQRQRFIDNGWYVGHDEPSVKSISARAGSANRMTYGMKLPFDPTATPTSTGSVTKYGELSVAPWFGLPLCDPKSFPRGPYTPDSDANNPNLAGSAFMELQFYPPGFAPFVDAISCSATRWCAALTIDSLECRTNGSCNNNCIEPVNFSFLQTNGIPPGSPAPQNPRLSTFLGNSHTLKMKPGDVLKVSITDPSGGLLAKVRDLTSGQVGYIQASAHNGFRNTNIKDCSGTLHTFHAEYNTAKKSHQVPWAALEGGVLMEQEIGHFEACNSVSNTMGFFVKYSNGSRYRDSSVAQTCVGGSEGQSATGEGPCNTSTFICQNGMAQGATGPVACPTTDATSGTLCDFSDGFCFPSGTRSVVINGVAATETWPVAGCLQNFSQNGDLDFDGTPYQADWPNGSSSFPSSIRYVGPFTGGHPYPYVQFETDVGGSEALCTPSTGAGCVAPPAGAAFYPFWSLNKTQILKGLSGTGVCVWNFGNDIANVTTRDFSKNAQYGKPDVNRYGGTLIGPVRTNPEFVTGCKSVSF